MRENFILNSTHYFMKNGIAKIKKVGEPDRKGKRIPLEEYDRAWNEYYQIMYA